jgi:hypothetical protein
LALENAGRVDLGRQSLKWFTMAEPTIKTDESKDGPFADTVGPGSDLDELPAKTKRWYKKKGKLLLWILALTILLRGFGVISLEFYSADTTRKVNIKSETRYSLQTQEQVTDRFEQKDYNEETTTNGWAREIGFKLLPDLDTEIETLIKKHLAKAKNIDVFQVKTEVSGNYLLPIFKDGHCEFSLKFGAKADSGKYFKGILTGVINFGISGVCSQRKLRELLSEQVATQLVKYIESDIRVAHKQR